MIHAVILAGGGGTRLWPLSRANYPKPFLRLLGEHTLLQQTVLRVGGAVAGGRMWVVTGREQESVVRAQLSVLPGVDGKAVQVLGEPASRNTAAAVGLAAVHLRRSDPDAVMIILPADHWIEREDSFVKLLRRAVELAEQEALITLGIVPDRAETGYGYIRRGRQLDNRDAYQVDRFVEKPNVQTAQTYLASGTHYWNAGIFCWRASTILEEMAAYMPSLYAGLEEIAGSLESDQSGEKLESVYQQLESVSIDYGVLERSQRLVVLAADIGWSDLGEWTAVYRLSPRDERGNVFSPNVVDIESENTFVYGGRRMIATIGLKNTVVVDADDALLICSHDRIQQVKAMVGQLQARGVDAAQNTRTVQRPWGTYTVLEEGERFKVKRIIVHAGAALSLQLHRHRSEHWVVVSGVAQVTNGGGQFLLHTNQSTYIPPETKHRLANPSAEPLEIIEVQSGAYLGEDDIVRFADVYGRAPS